MAKSKKETSSETPIVVNWVNENASKLSEVRSINPTLYSAITMALDYLNKSLGGVGDVVMPEVIAPPTTKNIDPRTTDLKIKINSEAESRAFQEWAFSFGIEWFRGGNYLDHLTSKYLYIDSKKLDWGDRDKTFNNFNELEVTLADLGIVLPLETINPLLYDIKIEVDNEAEARAFQEWAFSKGVKWSGGNNRVSHLDKKYFIIETTLMMFDPDGQYFKNSPARLVTLKDLGIVLSPPTIDPFTTNLKIKINSEAESRAFQEWAFSLGIEWDGGGSNLDNLTFPYLYIENKRLDWGQDDNTFKNFNELEVTLADLGIVLPLETIDPLTTDIKIEVNDLNEAQAFQTWAFNNGVKWWSASLSAKTSNLNHLGEKYFIIENGLLTFDEDGQYLRDSPATWVTLKDLGVTVPKTIVAVKKKPTPKVKATPTPTPPTPDVQNLYNELDDLDI